MIRLRRSTINVPGNDYGKIEAALKTDVDVIMVDLEDAVPESEKAYARDVTKKALQEMDFRKKLKCVRINAWETPYAKDDVAQMIAAGAEELKLTKCENPKDVEELAAWMSECEAANGRENGSVKISLMIESPLGVLYAYPLMSASKRIESVSLGAGDMASAMGIDRDLNACSIQFLMIKQWLVLTARAAGIRWILDTSMVKMPDKTEEESLEILKRECLETKLMGFTGRTCLYADSVPIVNELYSPTPAEADFAIKAIENWEKGVATGDRTWFSVNGRHLDIGKVEKAREVKELLDAIEFRTRK